MRFLRYASWQTDRWTYWQADRTTSHPYRGNNLRRCILYTDTYTRTPIFNSLVLAVHLKCCELNQYYSIRASSCMRLMCFILYEIWLARWPLFPCELPRGIRSCQHVVCGDEFFCMHRENRQTMKLTITRGSSGPTKFNYICPGGPRILGRRCKGANVAQAWGKFQ